MLIGIIIIFSLKRTSLFDLYYTILPLIYKNRIMEDMTENQFRGSQWVLI